MTAIIPSHFQDALEACIADLDGQDEMFFHDSAMRTIIWYVGKAKSIVHWSAEIRAQERGKFLEAVAVRQKVPMRRLQEAIAVYRREALPSDSVMETAERIFQKHGRWSKALPAKPEKQEEKVELVCGRCPIHCKHDTSS
jgi:hypothetical protein